MKKCKSCRELKELSFFTKAKSNVDGYQNTCKPCVVIRNNNYYKTEKGFIKKAYSNLFKNSKDRNHVMPDFSLDVFKTWSINNNFKTLFKVWKDSNYLKDLKPSVDRLDSTKPYTLINMRLCTWKENNEAAYLERREGTRITRQNRIVIQKDVEGNFINQFPSISKASRDTNICRVRINKCVKNKCDLAGGFKWEYSQDQPKNIPNPRDIKYNFK